MMDDYVERMNKRQPLPLNTLKTPTIGLSDDKTKD